MNEKIEVGKATPLRERQSIVVSESASELKEIRDMFVSIQESMVYMTKLMEAMVNNLSLAHKQKTDASELMKMNSNLLAGLFAGKEFQGKDLFMEMIEKINKMGAP